MSIRFEKVSKSFGSKKILDQISFDVPLGEIWFILGRSGVGKSVTLKSIMGLLSVDEGEITVGEWGVTRFKRSELGPVRKMCGMVFQHPALLDSLTVYENLALGLRAGVDPSRTPPLDSGWMDHRIREVLELLHLEERILALLPSQISYGMQKRVSLARTIAPGPQVLLFDEPTTGLDPITTRAVNQLIRDLSRRLNVTSLVVSHDMQCALDIADRILVLESGRIAELASPTELEKSQHPLVQGFLSETLMRRQSSEAKK